MVSKTNPTDDAYMSMQEVADKLGVSLSTVRRYIDKLKIPHISLGHQVKRLHWPTVKKLLTKIKR